jgi:hypothetical protein
MSTKTDFDLDDELDALLTKLRFQNRMFSAAPDRDRPEFLTTKCVPAPRARTGKTCPATLGNLPNQDLLSLLDILR